MAIQFAAVEIIHAGSGSAVGLSCYIERSKGRDEINGQSYNFERKGDLIESGLVLPDNAPEWMNDKEALWNRAIEREYVTDRKTGEFRLSKNGNPQVAKSYVLALPKELTNEQNSELVQSYIRENFEKSKVAVQWAIHAPHDGNENIHAHLLISTRRIGERGFEKKATELNPEFCKGRIIENDRIGEKWAGFQNRFFRERDIQLSVDPTRIIAGLNEGKARFIENSEKEKHQAALLERNRELARDPKQVLAHFLKNEASFTERKLESFLRKSGLDEAEQRKMREAVFAAPDLVKLEDIRQTAKGEKLVVERFTTSAVLEQEKRILSDGAGLRARDDLGVSDEAREVAIARRTLSEEQRAAFDYATRAEGLAIIQGRAGTGKSYTAGAIRDAYEQDGFRVIGLAPTNTVAADMRSDGFREGRTLAAELLRQENGREPWDGRTLVVLDEMGMVSSRDLDRLLSHARETGAKIVGFGDERQLASVERGGMFGPLAREAQAVELTQVNRQRVDWQREASEAASRGDFKSAIEAYAEHKNIRWMESVEDAYREIKAHWTDEAAQGKTPFVYAATNDAVDRLNCELRQARIELGQVSREGERVFATEKGERRSETALSVGDRIQFTATVKDRAQGLELRNGEFGTVLGIDENRLRVHTDSGRLVTFDASEHRGFTLGYAGTTYKGQGKTNESTILFYDDPHAWRARGAYVNLTRHKDDVRLVVPSELAPSRKELAQQMQRDDGRKAASAYRLVEQVNQKQECEPGVVRETTLKRLEIGRAGLFSGLKLNVESARSSLSEAKVRDDVVSTEFRHSLESYARAYCAIAEMRSQKLPIMHGQKQALAQATEALDRQRKGASALLRSALRHDPSMRQSMTVLSGSERVIALCAGMEKESELLRNPNVRADRFIEKWNSLEKERRSLMAWPQADQRAVVEKSMTRLADGLHKDGIAESLVRERSRELDIDSWRAGEKLSVALDRHIINHRDRGLELTL